MPVKPAKKSTSHLPGPPPAAAATLEELSNLVTRKQFLDITIGGKVLRVEFRTLRADESTILADKSATLMPPAKENPPEGEFNIETHLDWKDETFIAKKRSVENVCRALAVYWCCPMFQLASPNLSTEAGILEFVNSKLDENLLDQIYNAIQRSPYEEIALANFI